jgi:multiple sugar transport system ATP-binding protein
MHALRGIDLDIPEGEFTVFVGPSGCGKSTLLRTIAGLEDVNKGHIEIDDQIVNNMRPRDRDVAMVFQNYALYPYMNVFENIAFGLRARKFAETEVQKRVANAAEMLGITNLLERLPKQLSGGQRQRVAIGRAIVRDARLFLFDEPLSNLDAQLREEMRSEIKRLHQDIGKTMIYVTHDQIEAMTLADRIVLLKDGLIEQVGAPLDLFERPATRFVAGFLGSPSINFVPVTLVGENGQLALRFADDTRLPLPEHRQQKLNNWHAKKLICGVRPEHMRRARDDEHSPAELAVTFELIQPTGARSYGTFRLDGIPVVAELQAHDIKHTGEQLRLSVDMDRIILVDPATDQVI